MKIFLISNMFPSKNDGLFGVFVKNFKEELEDHHITFSETALIKGRAISTLKKIRNYSVHYFKIVSSFFKDYDLIYVHFITHHIPILLILLPFKNKPWVLNAHGDDIIGLQKSRFLNYFAVKILKKVDLIVVPTSYFKEKILKNYPFIESSKVFISPSGGISPKLFYKKKNIEENKVITLGFVSRFIEEKGWKTFLESLKLLQQNNVCFNAVIAGKGPDEELIKDYIKKNDINGTNFLGFVNQKDLVHLYNQLDLYIFPTYREGESLGLTGIEAMACGTPVIACNMAGPSTYIKPGLNGYLFEPKNSNQLYKYIMSYISKNELEKKKMIQEALDTSKEYEQKLVAKKLVIQLNSIVNSVR
ncbi:glycosyltransferase family 4 protein [Mesonia ostreae]|uniref:Glycosyltransferase family 4 protein n=1 Tax=Mesonia ostreae TaxID=861110 RepID=A0ABU2KIZ3_9FLAO|nr:glycosyltransferase family 4 protein [Mesonia ostreae]MDT0294657.1 glycosyltransferase family 4 protein [Mesonia ostreae]